MNTTDSKPHYDVTAGLIWRDGKLLISKRPKGGHLEGFWEFPGGKQKAGEGLRACLERELREELGIQVMAVKPFLSVDHEYIEKRITLHVFVCAWLEGDPSAIECQAFKWVDPDELTTLPFPPPDLRVIQTLTGCA